MLFARKQGLAHSYFCENESLRHCLSYNWRQMATFLGCKVRFFERIRFLGGPFFLRPRVRFRARFSVDAFPFNENFVKLIHGKCVKI